MRRLKIIPLIAVVACTRPQPDLPRGESGGTQPVITRLSRAREMHPGDSVRVEGVATVASGVVDAGFALQDGPRAIYVAADSGARVQRGQVVRVDGRLADQHGLLVIQPNRVKVTGRTAPLPAYELRTKRVGEITEAMLVRVGGRITAPVVDDRPYGWKIMIDDGSGPLQLFVPAHHAFDPAPYQPGKTLRAEGMSAQYDSTYEVIATAPLRLEP